MKFSKRNRDSELQKEHFFHNSAWCSFEFLEPPNGVCFLSGLSGVQKLLDVENNFSFRQS